MSLCEGGNMVNYVTKKRETKHERGGLCLDEEEAHYYFVGLLFPVDMFGLVVDGQQPWAEQCMKQVMVAFTSLAAYPACQEQLWQITRWREEASQSSCAQHTRQGWLQGTVMKVSQLTSIVS
jgi:hypothetical protein